MFQRSPDHVMNSEEHVEFHSDCFGFEERGVTRRDGKL